MVSLTTKINRSIARAPTMVGARLLRDLCSRNFFEDWFIARS